MLGALRRAQALIFDFDGTLVQSNEIKWRGFAAAFADCPDRLPEIMTYCRGHHHTVRGDKFRHVYEQILRRPYTSALAQQLHERFAAATTQAIIDADEVHGATVFLRDIPERYTTALLSSTPHDVLLDILSRRRLDHHFDRIQGAPVNKAAWLGTFRQEHGLTPEQTMFFGDTDEDMRSAQTARCTFVGVGRAVAGASYVVDDFRTLAWTRP